MWRDDFQADSRRFYHTVLEVTRQVLGRRRMTMLLKLSERTATASDLKSFWNLIVECLDENELDVPFAVLYSISDEIEDDPEQPNSPRSSSRGSFLSKQCVLEGKRHFHTNNTCKSDQGVFENFIQALWHGAWIPLDLTSTSESRLTFLQVVLDFQRLTEPCSIE